MVTPTLLAQRYRVDRQIGIGGMGAVFAATDERLGRAVAVKLLKEELSSDDHFVERFRREARAAAALSHPNVANVYDFAEDDGRYFIAMELVEGKDLARVMREDGPLGVERALAIGELIASALGHAHAAGLVHRDVKPHNVIVGSSDTIKVTDFGIARATGDSKLTATGTILGTAQYVSPEQASGEPVGPQSDVYSLGIVLFEMLTGAVPFTGDSPISIAMRHVRDKVPAPSSIDSEIPRHVDELVATATAKQPDERYPDGNAFAAAIRQDDTSPVTSTTAVAAEEATWPFAQGPRWDPARLGRTIVIVFVILFALALGALAFRLANTEVPRRETRARDQAPEPAGDEAPETPVVQSFPLDDYRGRPVDEAEAELKALGIVPERIPEDCGQDFGYVCEQEPDPGTTVTEGDTVTLVYNSVEEDQDDESDEDDSVGKHGKEPPGQKKKEDKDD